jgi:hypothetical protein
LSPRTGTALWLCVAAAGCGRAPARPADWVPLAVEHDFGGPARLRVGDALTLRPALRNISGRPVEVRHGARLFVLEAARTPRAADAAAARLPLDGAPRLELPRADSWGEERRWEFPNPSAVYTANLISKLLAPGERYAPAVLNDRAELRIPFDSAGTYAARLCADVNGVRICGRRDISVTVE